VWHGPFRYLHTEGMFDKKAQAKAVILDLESIGNVTDTDIHGVHWDAICPECGARVDQSRASMTEHPTCEYCAKPLPCEPVL